MTVKALIRFSGWWLIAIVALPLFWLVNVFFESQDHHVYVQSAEASEVYAHVVFGHRSLASGLAHYVEHLAWLNTVGAKQRSANRHSNAWTNPYAVGYWLSGKPDELDDLLQTLSGLFEPLEVPAKFAAEEREIILREYEAHMVDKPDAQAAEAMSAFLYAGNNIASSVLGTPDDIRGFSYDDARALHAATHRPENATLVVTGGVTEREVSRALKTVDWPAKQSADAESQPPTFELAKPADTLLRYPEKEASARVILRHVAALPESIPFDLLEAHALLLADILNTNLAGGLAGPLRFDNAIARGFDVQAWPLDERHIELRFRAAPDRGVSLRAVQKAFRDTLAEISDTGIPDETYQRVLNRFEDFWPDWEDDDDAARWMADYTLERVAALRQPLPLSDVKRLEQQLSHQRINTLLNTIAGNGRTAVAFIGPKERFE
ncbi:M16 family metallopeptidase [Vreelandella zhaodongensis]|uniref:Insulinase family protein n=1 Tax=Vreelandella zhaodongensis TaxID=1176240 RepID=A0ABX2SSK3_VREZH|nr:insulinase family protein [Halomonas zhaodongensis]NYS45019.1 insulinase family protein [Halomonas zhaodongensis]